MITDEYDGGTVEVMARTVAITGFEASVSLGGAITFGDRLAGFGIKYQWKIL